MSNYNPFNWYWLAEDGRIFSSAVQAIVPATNPGYVAFIEATAPTPWPRDDNGNQTSDELGKVLAPYGMFSDLTSYAADRRWRAEIGGIEVGGMPVATDDRSKQMILGARIAADADATFVTRWAVGDQTFALNAEQIIAISNAVLAHVNACFVAFSTLAAAISATPPTVTTRAQITTAFAAIQ